MSFSYSGSTKVTRGVQKVFSDSTYYSFKTTEECRISVDGMPLVFVGAGEEFIIKVGAVYIFDRTTTIMLSYPEADAVVPPTWEAKVTTDNAIYASTGFTTLVTIPVFDELTSYDLYASVAYWKVSAATITMKVVVGATTLATVDVYCPTSQYTILSINEAKTTTIAANSIVELQVENGGTNDSVVGSRVPTVLSLRDTA